MDSSLTSLPEDILLDIFLRLSVIDVLSLKQTCRVLHVVASMDYLWHQLTPNLDLPLDIPLDAPVNTLSGSVLQQKAISAIRLERNWKSSTPRIKRVIPLRYGIADMSIDELRLLPGATWLVTAQRNRLRGRVTTTFTFWSLGDVTDVYRAAVFETPGYYKHFSVSLRKANNHAITALTLTIDGTEYLQVYVVPLDNRLDSEFPVRPVSYLKHSIPRPPGTSGIFYQVVICGDVVATTLVNLTEASVRTDQILLLNTSNGVAKLIGLRFREAISRVHIKLYADQIAVIAAMENALIVRTYALPPPILNNASAVAPLIPGSIQQEDLGPILVDCVVGKLPNANDFFISDSTNIGEDSLPSHLCILTFRFIENMPGRLYVVHVPLGWRTSVRFAVYPKIVLMSKAHVADLVHIGTTGRRAVWVERDVETERSQLMKLYSPAERVEQNFESGVLLPAYPELPFRPNAFRSLAFDEVTGRLCLGLYTGELYALDFV